MFSGYPMKSVDGTKWYFPQRLTDDTAAVDNGNANPAQKVLDVDATMGHALPRRLRIYTFGARLGGAAVLQDARISWPGGDPHVRRATVALVNRRPTRTTTPPGPIPPMSSSLTSSRS